MAALSIVVSLYLIAKVQSTLSAEIPLPADILSLSGSVTSMLFPFSETLPQKRLGTISDLYLNLKPSNQDFVSVRAHVE